MATQQLQELGPEVMPETRKRSKLFSATKHGSYTKSICVSRAENASL